MPPRRRARAMRGRNHTPRAADRGLPIYTPTARHCPRDAGHGQCRSVPYVPASHAATSALAPALSHDPQKQRDEFTLAMRVRLGKDGFQLIARRLP